MENDQAGERDLIQLAYQSAVMDEYQNTDSSRTFVDFLEEELAANGLTGATVTDRGDGSYIVTLENVNQYTVEGNGSVEGRELSPVAQAKKSGEILSTTENKTIEDDNGNPVTIPAGFKVASDSATSVKGGIVIEDEDVTEDGNGDLRGNQFVWIPVTKDVNGNNTTPYRETGKLATGEVIKLSRYEFADGTSSYIANDGTSLGVLDLGTPIDRRTAAIVDSYNSSVTHAEDTTSYSNTKALNLSGEGGFKGSVATNGGYYIARYEASYGTDGKANSKISTSYTTSTNAPTTEGALWNNITQPNAATASRKIYEGNTNYTSDLVNSYAWDTAIVFIQSCGGTEYEAYSRKIGQTRIGTPISTGKYGDKPLNINDMASNTLEWTTETSSYSYLPCTYRGGYWRQHLLH